MLTGNLKSLLPYWENLAKHHRYSSYFENQDLTIFFSRAANEGLTFLTTTLPSLGKSLDRFHSTKEWIPPSGFKLDCDGFPIFLGKAMKGSVLGSDHRAVDMIRQLSYLYYKLEVPYDEQTVSSFLDNFVKIDRDVGSAQDEQSDYFRALLDGISLVIGRVLCNSDPSNIRPCHGGGSTACRTSVADRWHKLRYFAELDSIYPYSDYFYFNYDHLVDDLEEMEIAEDGIPRARVCLVPKDSRGPRVISCEPAELMFIQQGIMRSLYETLENHPLTRGQINFSDQAINRGLAQTGSEWNHLATIDLKDASDRVSLRLVERVFPLNWVKSLKACRSKETILPDGRVVELQKFAPMGSSCCFPVEALVFWACVRTAISIDHGTIPSVYVYGDDIIVESKYYDSAVAGLSAVGLMVNADKSYRDGPFRESCGGDFYLGVDVTPLRLTKIPISVGSSLLSSADFLNETIQKFGPEDLGPLIRHVEGTLGYPFPRSNLPLPGTIRLNPSASNDALFRRRWNNDLQRYEHRVLQSFTICKKKYPPNWRELLRKELCSADGRQDREHPYENALNHANRQAEPGYYADNHSVRTKWKWTWLGEPVQE